MNGLEPEQITIETEKNENEDGQKAARRKIMVDTEDIVALFSGIVAVIFALGMAFGKIPINEMTYGIVGLASAGAVISRIVKAKNRSRARRTS